MHSSSDPNTLLLILIFFIGSSIVVAIKKWLLKKAPAYYDNKAVLFSYYSTGNDLFAGERQELNNVEGHATCTSLVTMPLRTDTRSEYDAVSAPAGRTIALVELPFRSKLHVLAITKNGNLEQLNPSIGDSVMHKIELEGDFSNYFTLYIDRDDHLQLRYVFDPKAMAFVVDFCRKYHWEIVDDTIYIVSKTGPPDNTIIEQFIGEIRPALEDKNAPVTKSRYKQKTWPQTSPFKCPVCAGALMQYRYWHECPKGHGQLIIGANLTDRDIEQQYIRIGEKQQSASTQHYNLTCPVCRQSMQSVRYGASKIVIDSCTSCSYRWLDSGEWTRIINRVS